jgi:large subunit ribosomal protein L15
MGLRLENIKRPAKLAGKGKRLGRGVGSGKGKTSGRGHKGAGQRSGGKSYTPGFEGGQLPLIRRLPKRGFTNKWRRQWDIVNVGALQKCDKIEDGMVINKEFLLENRLLRKKRLSSRVLGKGSLKKQITVKANYFSNAAREAIEKAGGKAELVKES